MNISEALMGVVMLEYQEEDWEQTLEYEHIPFYYKKCHKHTRS